MQNLVDNLVIEMTLVDPIQKIVKGLNDGEYYRESDVKWLQEKLHSYIEIAAKTLGVEQHLLTNIPVGKFTTMNEPAKDYFKTYFSQLLQFFQSVLLVQE